jgi:chromosome segregation protein
LNKLEVRLAEERSQIGFIEENSRDTHQADLASIDWKMELWEAAVEFEKRVNLMKWTTPINSQASQRRNAENRLRKSLPKWIKPTGSEVEEEVRELKGRLASMGPVNLEAIGEYADLKERHDFLKNQSEDLWNSKNALVQSIDSINETSQNLFRDTFEQVRKNFAFTYDKLSGGGFRGSQIDRFRRSPGVRNRNYCPPSGNAPQERYAPFRRTTHHGGGGAPLCDLFG